tara:strand:- start:2950 stop:3516 length:567 start_codon:yes stop_codon:yes gene_type:complete
MTNASKTTAQNWLTQHVTIVKSGGTNAELLALVPHNGTAEIPLANAPETIQNTWAADDSLISKPVYNTLGFVLYSIEGDVPSEQKKNLKTKPINDCLVAPRGFICLTAADTLFTEVQWAKRYYVECLVESRKPNKNGELVRTSKKYARIISARNRDIAKAKMKSKMANKGLPYSVGCNDLSEQSNWAR